MLLRLADWLDDSPTKKVLVAGAAILAFVLSLVNGGWTVWKEYRALTKIPTIYILSRTSYSISAPVAVEQVLGTFAGSTKNDNRVLMPYFPLTIEISNPTGQRTSLSHCVLTLEFYQRQGLYESMGYMAPQTLIANAFEESPVVPVESGGTNRVELLFFFLPTPEFKPLLNDKTTQPYRFRVACRNEAGERIESRVS
jgi:hypothetical protein